MAWRREAWCRTASARPAPAWHCAQPAITFREDRRVVAGKFLGIAAMRKQRRGQVNRIAQQVADFGENSPVGTSASLIAPSPFWANCAQCEQVAHELDDFGLGIGIAQHVTLVVLRHGRAQFCASAGAPDPSAARLASAARQSSIASSSILVPRVVAELRATIPAPPHFGIADIAQAVPQFIGIGLSEGGGFSRSVRWQAARLAAS